MKNIAITILLFISAIAAQAQAKITFGYDAAGNQSSRVYCSDGISCEGIDHKTIIDKAPSSEEIIAEIQKTDETIAEKIHIYPNPTKDLITLSWEASVSNRIANIIISNSAGLGIQKVPFDSKEQHLTIDLGNFADGLYIVRFYLNDGKVLTEKIIKH